MSATTTSPSTAGASSTTSPTRGSSAARARLLRTLAQLGTGIVLAGAVLVSIFPFYWMLRTAVSPADEIFFQGISLVPSQIDLSGFARAWERGGLGDAIVTGVIVTGGILLLQLLTCVPAAYVLTKVRFPGRGIALSLVLACLLIPSQATLIPTFIGINAVGLADSMAALILPFMTSAFGIYLLRQQMTAIPDALLEAARADGLGHGRILVTVVAPLAAPGIAAFSVFSVFVHWNEYLWPLLVARSPELRTPPLALAVFQQMDIGFDYAALAAGAAIVTAPVVLLFLFAQKRFVQGMSGTEIPG
ncbi:carbohydrate ABC transporter permease [Microbacterium album]|uniref:Sn-glycerol-3-phosphate transport system permease protein UgpE n=1 Tax=Microbacterium album TaxID=2053191 RepID=A0A917IH83_9MICO|nr:carbohydrate ABC transporter permease [Microbacterium album]GGH45636.1 sn-glycerol-3-phosphate transport system permease protein UgpE [Microbacterium album]